MTPNKKQQPKCEQVAPKKLQTAMKKGLEDYFGKGKRAPVPSTEGNPISAVVQRRTERGDTQQDMGGNGDGSFALNRMDMESATTINGQHQIRRRETSLVGVRATMTARIRKPDPTTTIQKARRVQNKNKVQRRRQNRET